MKKGQSLVEVVFAIGVLGLILTGVVLLVIKSISFSTKTNINDKAVELGNALMEELISNRASDPSNFWLLSNIPAGQTRSDYPGLTYSITFNRKTTNGCSPTRVDCAYVTITINWTDETSHQVSFNRFFKR